jgi:N-acyl-D-aspartate/D-glutamate deacylase
MLDVPIQNGQVVDGSRAPRYRADVAIAGGHFVDEVTRASRMSSSTAGW